MQDSLLKPRHPMGGCSPVRRSLARRPRRLRRSELPKDTVEMARYLLGKLIIRRFDDTLVAGRIVETEAYTHDEPACHAHRGETRRNRSLFLQRGHAYVYLCYGTSYLLNVTSGTAGVGSGVLLRALEPVMGVERMHVARGQSRGERLTNGPGRLTQALDVDLSFDGVDLVCAGRLWLAQDGFAAKEIRVSTRVGITKAAHLPRRFFIAGNRFVSKAPNFTRASCLG